MLLSKLISIAVTWIAIAISVSLLFFLFKDMTKHDLAFSRIENHFILEKRFAGICMQSNTFHNPVNETLSCLKTGSCTNGTQGTLTLFDFENAPFSILTNEPGTGLYREDLTPCQGDDCDYRLKSHYRIECSEGTCANPIVELRLNFIPLDDSQEILPVTLIQRLRYRPVFRNCKEVADSGAINDSLYSIDIDGVGGRCPFTVFCRLSDGLGSALVANAPSPGYSDLPFIEPPLLLSSTGRLKPDIVQALIAGKKIEAEIKGSAAGKLRVRLNMPSADSALYSASIDNCTHLAPSQFTGEAHGGQYYGVVASQLGSSIGFIASNLEGSPSGFHCSTCDKDSACGLPANACCENSLRGSLWVH